MTSQKLQDSQEGFVLVACMMIMVVLTIVGMMAVNTTEMELLISGNDKVAKSAFFRADSGIFTAPKVVRQMISDDNTVLTTLDVDGTRGDAAVNGDFYRKIMGFDNAAGNISFAQGENNINDNNRLISTDILRSGEEKLPGESVEFASGYDGGPTASQGVALLYRLDSTGTAPGDAVSRITALYRFIPGRPGGL